MTTNVSNEIDPRQFRQALGQFATGVTVITTPAADEVHGMTANAFMSGSLEPPLVIISVNRKGRMCSLIEESGVFGVSILSRQHESHSRHFGGQPQSELPLAFRRIADIPVLDGPVTAIAAQVVAAHECGDHILFVGHVQAIETSESEPLLFFKGRYSQLAG